MREKLSCLFRAFNIPLLSERLFFARAAMEQFDPQWLKKPQGKLGHLHFAGMQCHRGAGHVPLLEDPPPGGGGSLSSGGAGAERLPHPSNSFFWRVSLCASVCCW